MLSKIYEKGCMEEEIDIGPHLGYFSTVEFCNYICYYKNFKSYTLVETFNLQLFLLCPESALASALYL